MGSVSGLKLNIRGINRIMGSDSAQDIVDAEGRAISGRAGRNFEYVQRRHKWTARGYVQATNEEGRIEEAANKVLTKAIGARVPASNDSSLVRYTRKRDGKTIWATQAQVENWTRSR
ncbi:MULTISPECIES: hypothetical protein [unclassified Microbacterium]|uniref:hypothetical protein n=1 Tax=unclassified Microbacterium TaxID=2609290 RepID=UPI0010F4F3B8|nr:MULTISPECIES: hypothetical protein [unclassified Microbacterium]